MSTQLIIAAAGLGRRLGRQSPKALVELCGRSIISRTVDRLLAVAFDPPLVVIIPSGCEGDFKEALNDVPADVRYVNGGEERQASVRNGLDALNPHTEIVAIHDAARPFPPVRAVCDAIDAARRYGGATLATPVADTMLMDDGSGFLDATPDRAMLWACQTPQVFQVDIIRRAHDEARNLGIVCTDDATLAQRIGCRVKLVDGGAMNFKITTKRDLAFACYLLEQPV